MKYTFEGTEYVVRFHNSRLQNTKRKPQIVHYVVSNDQNAI